jgi:hypothetical protein
MTNAPRRRWVGGRAPTSWWSRSLELVKTEIWQAIQVSRQPEFIHRSPFVRIPHQGSRVRSPARLRSPDFLVFRFRDPPTQRSSFVQRNDPFVHFVVTSRTFYAFITFPRVEVDVVGNGGGGEYSSGSTPKRTYRRATMVRRRWIGRSRSPPRPATVRPRCPTPR